MNDRPSIANVTTDWGSRDAADRTLSPKCVACCSISFWFAVFEVVGIVVLFFVYAGHPAPDVNEAHYLTKAKQFWQPDWCLGDTFLESEDAHLVFYWTAGWLTRWGSLPAVAWVGRFMTWTLLAAAWHGLIHSMVPRRGYSLLAAAIALCLWHHFHLAGEWVVGGFEAKGFALAFLFVAFGSVALRRWHRAYLALGAASAFHVLIGGWGVVAVSIAMLIHWRTERGQSRRIVAHLIGGGLLSLPGLLPAISLMRGVDNVTKQRAAEVYVDRLAHHLELYRMAPERIAAFGVLVSCWFLIWFWKRSVDRNAAHRMDGHRESRHRTYDRGAEGESAEGERRRGKEVNESVRSRAGRPQPKRPQPKRPQPKRPADAWCRFGAFSSDRRDPGSYRQRIKRVQTVVLVTIAIGLVGWLLDYLSIVAPVTKRLLRFYWFRLADVAVPMGVVLYIVDWLRREAPNRKRNFVFCVILVSTAVMLAFGFLATPARRVPPAFVQGLGRDLPFSRLERDWRDWQDVCKWIDGSVAKKARFLTPTTSQTFCWYANRPEVAVWKNIPQDARSILRWHEAMNDISASSIYPKPNAVAPPAFVDPASLAEKYAFDYVVATSFPRIGWPEVYRNATYRVYQKPGKSRPGRDPFR